MELTSNTFYYCTPGAGKLPKSFRNKKERRKRKRLNHLGKAKENTEITAQVHICPM
jgi:hypothetical protein